ncbi:putative uncharacterized protein [Clostridium sp. CAG:448]|nr:putative uncharacterized protein [Clostridium sp. CAG:448]
MAEVNTSTKKGGTSENKNPRGRVFSAIWRVILILLAAVLAITSGTLAYDKFVKKSKIPSVFGYSMLIIASPSMTGSIEAGDAIIIKNSDSYAVGDVITYFPADESFSVTHRIVRMEGDKFYTKGDANQSEDPDPVLIEQIAGKVAVKLDKVGYFIEWLKSPAGIIFAATFIVLLILIIVIADKRRGKTGSADSESK